MSLEYFAKYPFTAEAKKFVEDLELSLDQLLEHPVYSACLEYGRDRFQACVEGEYKPVLSDESKMKLTVLGYPIARLIAHSAKDRSLLSRYAKGEAELTYNIVVRENPTLQDKLVSSIGLEILDGRISLVDFIKLTGDLSDMPRFNLVNRVVKDGWVEVSADEVPRLVGQWVRNKVLQPVDLKNIPKQIVKTAMEVKAEVKPGFEELRIEELEEDALPPCIKYIIVLLGSGELNHNGMFTLATFLINLGLPVEAILSIFKKSPKFKDDTARYQIEFLSGEKTGTEYTCPTCETIKGHGFCRTECNVKHPLQYYRQHMKRIPVKTEDK